MKKILVSLIALACANATAEIVSVQAVPTIKSLDGYTVTFSFSTTSTTSNLSEVCINALGKGLEVEFQGSYNILKKAANNNTSLTLNLNSSYDDSMGPPVDTCSINSIDL